VCASTPGYRRKSHTLVAERAAEAWGVLCLAELLECGLTEPAAGRWVAAGHLHRTYRGVYAVGHAGLTPEGRWLAAVKACGPGARLGHQSAAMLLGLLPLDDRRPDVLVPAGSSRAPADINVHRTRALPPEDVWRHKRIPTTTAARTILDLAPTSTDRALRRLMATAQSKHLTNLRLLAQQLDRAQGRPGRALFARVLATGPAPTRSELEDRVRDLVLAGGFPPPDVNVPLRIGGRRVIPDLRWPEKRLCVEADSLEWHDNPQARRDDVERQALLEQDGERVLRVTWEQAVAHPAQTLRRIGLAYSGGPGSGPRAASSASPIASTMSSVPLGPTSSMPTGRPSPVRPAGTDSAGIPALEA
jgi:very-short-patch-repair endonuclease